MKASARVLAVLVLAAISSGCGVKLVYNHMDRLIIWGVDDLVTLDPEQQRYLKGEVDSILYWHRTTQLPIYARAFERLADQLDRGPSLEDLMATEQMVNDWADAIGQRTNPVAAEILYSMTDAQLTSLAAGLDANNAKWLKPYRDLNPQERTEKWAKEYIELMENFTPRLTSEERALVEHRSTGYESDDAAWLDYRKRWQHDLIESVRAHDGFERFSLAYTDMSNHRERWYGADYQRILDSNASLYRKVTLELLQMLSDEQRKKLTAKLRGYAQDFDDLAADAPPTPPVSALCLVTCGSEKAVGA
jgi:uncharacterized protein DUF6279